MAQQQIVNCDLCGAKIEGETPFKIVQAFIGRIGANMRNGFDVCPACMTKPISSLVAAIKPASPPKPQSIAPRRTAVTPAGNPVTPPTNAS